MEKKTMTITEAAKVLGIGRNNAYAAARNGDIPTIKIGKRILVLTAPLKKMLGEAAQMSDARSMRRDHLRHSQAVRGRIDGR